jgi:hypothetical protein
MPKQFTKSYVATMSSLNGLKITVEADEANLTAKLLSLELGETDNGTAGTEGKFERATGINLGHLIFEEYTTEVDANSREAIHQTQNEPLVCKGHAFINNQAKNVIVFRQKAPL